MNTLHDGCLPWIQQFPEALPNGPESESRIRAFAEFPEKNRAGVSPSHFGSGNCCLVIDAHNAKRYHWMAMIQSFGCKETEKIFRREMSRRFPPEIQRQALRKLLMIHAAPDLQALRIPPSNRLEALSGDRRGQWSIRVNDQ